MKRSVAIGLSPNLEKDDINLAFKNFFTGKIFRLNGIEITKIYSWFKNNLGVNHCFSFNSGRSALYVALVSLNLKPGSEVLIQAFTCVSVPDCVIWAGLKPVYVDISKKDFNIDFEELKKKITQNTKVIIVQHTFGIPARIEEIKELAVKHNIIVIEDCAHVIGTKINKEYLGKFGDLSFFSFGRDKIISSVFGGLLVVNNEKFFNEVNANYEKLAFPGRRWIFKQYLHIYLMIIVLPFYNFLKLGKLVLYFFQKLNLLTFPVSEKEKQGVKPLDVPLKYPASLASLALNQLVKLKSFNKLREKYVNLYSKNFGLNRFSNYPLLRYPILVRDREEVMIATESKGILLGKWYSNIIDPYGVDLDKVGYTPCPIAEYVAQHIINLPTYPSLEKNQAEKIISLIEKKQIIN